MYNTLYLVKAEYNYYSYSRTTSTLAYIVYEIVSILLDRNFPEKSHLIKSVVVSMTMPLVCADRKTW